MSEQHAHDENSLPEQPGEENNVTDLSAAKIAELETKLSEANDKMLRALAEADNVRKRGEKDRQDISKFAISSFARDLLNVADNLRRALGAMTPEQRSANEAVKNIYLGIEATERELLRIFETNGIKRNDPIGQKFDPNVHEVMFEADMPDKAAGTIIQVMDAGYTIHERLLRPARVGVSKGGTAEQSTKVDQEV